MGLAHCRFLATRPQSLECVFADRLQHREADAASASRLTDEQALVHQDAERPGKIEITGGIGNGFRLLRSKAAQKNAQPAEKALLVLMEKVVAPVDRICQRPL